MYQSSTIKSFLSYQLFDLVSLSLSIPLMPKEVTHSIPRINFAVKEQTPRMVYLSRGLMPLGQINILAAENTISKTLLTNWIFLKTPVMFEINYSCRC